MTRLTSNIARSSWVASWAGGTAAPRSELVSESGVVGWATGPPLRSRFGAGADADAQDLHDRPESGRAVPQYAPRAAPVESIFLRDPPERAPRGWTNRAIKRVGSLSSPGDFPRGRPALKTLLRLPFPA